MAYRHGFKTEANDIAREVRSELGLSALAAFKPIDLANHLAIRILTLSDFCETVPQVQCLLSVERSAFSAITVFRGSERMIVHNDAHAPTRQQSNLTHELAHALLMHPPVPALDSRGCREWNNDIEDEAAWLAGALLVTEDVALAIARGDPSYVDACRQLGVSRRMMTYRLNVTGARRRVIRARNRWR